MQHPVVVVSFEAGAWCAGVEGRDERQVFGARYPALEWAHRWAQAHRPSLVRVFRQDGAVEDEWAYGAFKGIRRMGPEQFAAAPR
ncbi:MAG: DUF2188 domain-containing protein [Burkholderiales bacterium]